MDETFESSMAGYPETIKNLVREMIENDGGFHSSAYLSYDFLSDMIEVDENGMTFTQSNVVKDIDGIVSMSLELDRNDETKEWLFTLKYGENSFSGLLRMNTVYNAMGDVAFALVNSNKSETFDDITLSLPYSTFFCMVK